MGIAACKQITTRLHVYLGLILITQAILLGVFLAMDLLTFYMFFEAVLLPVILMIYLWGDAATSAKAARRFLLFTLAGSIPMIVGLIGLILYATPEGGPSTVLLPELSSAISAIDRPAEMVSGAAANAVQLQWILYLLLFGFGIKMAIVPLHSWLPTTYESAHPNSTALIAAVVGKLGIFGILRIVLPMMPFAMSQSAQWIFAGAGSIAIVYGALCALAQTDIRRLFAYSSISHLGFITVGLMSFKQFGIQGAILQMFNHGIIIAAVFILIAALEMRYGREKMLEQYHGFASKTPALACFFIFFLLAGAGLPGLNSFVGEIMTVGAMMQVSIPIACFSALGLLFGAWYSLRFVQYLFFGPTNERAEKHVLRTAVDLYPAEKIALIPLLILCVVIGVMPMLAIGIYQNDVLGMIDNLPANSNVAVASLDASINSQR
jgi:NADH-quinone oxidoreductase subunit M